MVYTRDTHCLLSHDGVTGDTGYCRTGVFKIDGAEPRVRITTGQSTTYGDTYVSLINI